MLSLQDQAAISSALVKFQAGDERALTRLLPLTQGFLVRKAKLLIFSSKALEPQDVVQQMWTNLADPARTKVSFNPASMLPTLYLQWQLQHAADELRRMLAPSGAKTKGSRQKSTEFTTVQLSDLPVEFEVVSGEADIVAVIDRKILTRYIYCRDKMLARVFRTMKQQGLSIDQAAHHMALSRFMVRRRLERLRSRFKY
jgi:hypothetical protein